MRLFDSAFLDQFYRGVAKWQRARFGSERSSVQPRPPRPSLPASSNGKTLGLYPSKDPRLMSAVCWFDSNRRYQAWFVWWPYTRSPALKRGFDSRTTLQFAAVAGRFKLRTFNPRMTVRFRPAVPLRCSSMAERLVVNQMTRVQFPTPEPFLLACSSKGERLILNQRARVRFSPGQPSGAGVMAAPLASNQKVRVRVPRAAPFLRLSFNGKGRRVSTAVMPVQVRRGAPSWESRIVAICLPPNQTTGVRFTPLPPFCRAGSRAQRPACIRQIEVRLLGAAPGLLWCNRQTRTT